MEMYSLWVREWNTCFYTRTFLSPATRADPCRYVDKSVYGYQARTRCNNRGWRNGGARSRKSIGTISGNCGCKKAIIFFFILRATKNRMYVVSRSLFFPLVVRLDALEKHPLILDDVIASVVDQQCLAPRQAQERLLQSDCASVDSNVTIFGRTLQIDTQLFTWRTDTTLFLRYLIDIPIDMMYRCRIRGTYSPRNLQPCSIESVR